MPIAVGASVSAGYSNSGSCTTGGVTTAASGSSFVVGVVWETNSTVPTISDSKGNTGWVQIGATRQGSAYPSYTAWFLKENGVGGTSHTFTATKASGYPSVFAVEITGGALSGLLDQNTGAASDASSPVTSGSITTTQADCLLLGLAGGLCSGNTTYTANNSFTTLQQRTSVSEWQGWLGYRVVSSTGTYESSVGVTNLTGMSGLVASFKAAASSITVTPGVANLTSARFAPSANAPRLVVPGVTALTLTQNAPAARLGMSVVPPAASLATNGLAPAIAAPRAAVPGTLALVATRYIPTISGPQTFTPGVANLTSTKFAPVLKLGVVPPVTGLTSTGLAPTLRLNKISTPGVVSLVTTKHSPTVTGGGGRPAPVLLQKWKKDWVTTSWVLETGSNPLTATAGKGLVCFTNCWDNESQLVPFPADSAGSFTQFTGAALFGTAFPRISTRIGYQLDPTPGSHTITPPSTLTDESEDGLIWIFEDETLPTSGLTVVTRNTEGNDDTSQTWDITTANGTPGLGDRIYAFTLYENDIVKPSADYTTPDGWTLMAVSNDATNNLPSWVGYFDPASSGAVTAEWTVNDANKKEDLTIIVGFRMSGASPQTVTPGAANLTMTAFAPTAPTPRLATPGVVNPATTKFAPTIRLDTIATPTTLSATTTKFAPVVSVPRLIIPGTRSLVTVKFAPTAAVPKNVVPGTAAVTTTTFAPTLVNPKSATPGTLLLTINRFAPTVTGDPTTFTGTIVGVLSLTPIFSASLSIEPVVTGTLEVSVDD